MPVKTKNEIEHVAQQRGWEVPKSLTLADINRASSDQIRFWEVFAPEAFTEAMNAPKVRQKVEADFVASYFSGERNAEVLQAMEAISPRLVELYPQVKASPENTTTLVNFLRDNGLDPTKIKSYSEAIEQLIAGGKLTVNPAAIGLKPNQEITGAALLRHPQLHLLAAASTKKSAEQLEDERIAAMSADEFKKEAFGREDISARQKAAEQRAFDTFYSMNPNFPKTESNLESLTLATVRYCQETGAPLSYNAVQAAFNSLAVDGALDQYAERVAKHGATKLIDLGGGRRQDGVPQYDAIEKPSLQAKIKNMSSSEYLAFVKESKSVRAAIDA